VGPLGGGGEEGGGVDIYLDQVWWLQLVAHARYIELNICIKKNFIIIMIFMPQNG